METGIDLKSAIEKAKAINPKYNTCIEHSNAWVFSYDDGQIHAGGPDTGTVILKEDGMVLRPYSYYFSDIGKSEIIAKTRI